MHDVRMIRANTYSCRIAMSQQTILFMSFNVLQRDRNVTFNPTYCACAEWRHENDLFKRIVKVIGRCKFGWCSRKKWGVKANMWLCPVINVTSTEIIITSLTRYLEAIKENDKSKRTKSLVIIPS